MVTFKELEKDSKIIKRIKKAGLSLAIIFSKEEIKKFDLQYDDEVDLGEASIIKPKVI